MGFLDELKEKKSGGFLDELVGNEAPTTSLQPEIPEQDLEDRPFGSGEYYGLLEEDEEKPIRSAIRAGAKGVATSALELPSFFIRKGVETTEQIGMGGGDDIPGVGLVPSEATPDESSRYKTTPSETDYGMVPGLLHPTVMAHKDGTYNRNPDMETVNAGITEMNEALSNFVVDLVPSLYTSDWKPTIESKVEKEVQKTVESYAMLPFEILAFVPQRINEGIVEATGDKVLGFAGELAAFGGIGRAVHGGYGAWRHRDTGYRQGILDVIKREIDELKEQPVGFILEEDAQTHQLLIDAETGEQLVVKKEVTDNKDRLTTRKAVKAEQVRAEKKRKKQSKKRFIQDQEEVLVAEAMSNINEIVIQIRAAGEAALKAEGVPTPSLTPEPKPRAKPPKAKKYKVSKVGNLHFVTLDGKIVSNKMTLKEARKVVRVRNRQEATSPAPEVAPVAPDTRPLAEQVAEFKAKQGPPLRPISPERQRFKSAQDAESVAPAASLKVEQVQEQRLEPRETVADIKARRKKKTVTKPVKAPEKVVAPVEKVVTDAELKAMHEAITGKGQVVRFTEPMRGSVNFTAYPESIDALSSAYMLEDGSLIVGKGNADAHRILREEMTEAQRQHAQRNMKTHQGWVDEYDRFISLEDLSKAKGDVTDAYTMKYGEPLVAGKQAMKTKPEEPALLTNEQGAEYVGEMDFSSGAEWDITKTVGTNDIHITKEKGKTLADLTVDGHKKGSVTKKFAEAVLRDLGNERGQAQLITDVANDAANKARDARGLVRRISEGIAASLWPDRVTPKAKVTAGSIRHQNARLDLAMERLKASFRNAHKQFSKLPIDRQVDFIDNIERGRHDRQAPEFQELSRELRRQLDETWAEVVALGGSAVMIEHYFPRYWDLKKGQVERIHGRRPITGAKSFQKQRALEYFVDGLDPMRDGGALEPISYNPIDNFLWKMQEMNKYITGKIIFNELKTGIDGAPGFIRFVKNMEEIPAGYTVLEDPIAQAMQFDPKTKAFIKRGQYVAPEAVARVFNNYLKPGLYGQGSIPYNFFRAGNTLMNMVQLGLSAFHFMFTALDAQGSTLHAGLEAMLSGDFSAASFKTVGKGLTPGAPAIMHFRRGRKITKAIRSIDPINAEMLENFQRIEIGGGGVGLEKYYDLEMNTKMKRDFAKREWVSGGLKLPFVAIEKISNITLKHWVPPLKLSLHLERVDAYHRLMAKKGIEPTLTERRAAYSNFWDGVDNRMGQLRYDNLMWNRKGKDVGMVLNRALGWNLGSLREIGAGIIIKPFTELIPNIFGKKVKWAEGKTFIPRETLYSAVLLGITVPMMTYLYSGMRSMASDWDNFDVNDFLNPENIYFNKDGGLKSVKELWFAKTGRIRPDGSEELVSLASYAKDVLAWKGHPLRTLGHKVSPFISLLTGAIENKRFDGEMIWDNTKGYMDNFGGVARYGAESFIPFSFRNIADGRRAEGKDYTYLEGMDPRNLTGNDVQRFFGVVPAPAYITRSSAENLASEYIRGRIGNAPITGAEASKRVKKRALFSAYANEDEALIREAIKESGLTRSELKAIRKKSKTPRLVSNMMSLKPHEIIPVLERCTVEEMESVKKPLKKNIKRKRTLHRSEKLELLATVEAEYRRRGLTW